MPSPLHSRLFWKLFAIQLGAGMALVACALLVLRWHTTHYFSAYVDQAQQQRLAATAERVARAYRDSGDLERAADSLMPLHDLPPPTREGVLLPPERRPHPPLQVQDPQGRFVAGDARPIPPADAWRAPIRVDGVTIGFLAQPVRGGRLSEAEARFVDQQEADLQSAAGIALVLAVAVAAVIAVLVQRPLRALSQGAAALARRDFSARLDASRHDELGQLAADFNQLAATLEAFEQQRRQWLADIAHELRTPLAVLRGELEALLDGVRTADANSLPSLNQEVMRLVAMVDDLHLLSLAEGGGLRIEAQHVEVDELVESTLERYRDRFVARGFELQAQVVSAGLGVSADRQRLEQVLANLLENALRYATPPGPVLIEAGEEGGVVRLGVSDAGPGVPDDALPRLFDRLYRADKARSRTGAGSGLGLAICRSLVEAQGGRIRAQRNARGGLSFVLELPHHRAPPGADTGPLP